MVNSFVQTLTNAVTRRDSSRQNSQASLRSADTAAAVDSPVEQHALPDHALQPEILATIGEEFAHDLTQAMHLIHQAVVNPRLHGVGLSKTHFLVEGLRRKAMSMQQMARLAQNRLRQSHEKLVLGEVVQSVVDERRAENLALGVVVQTRFKPVEIIVDPGLLVGLIGAAMDWVGEFGTMIRANTGMKHWPQHGQLTLSATQGVRTQDDIEKRNAVNQSIAWHLLQQTAVAMGVGVEITENINERTVLIEFPRTVVALEGMTMMEIDTGFSSTDSFGSVNSNFIAGHQVLLISPDYKLFNLVRDICKSLSLRCEQAPTVQMAERLCEQSTPHLIMCEEEFKDEQYDQLLGDLRRHNPDFPTIMVTQGGYGFEISGWSSENSSRVSRERIEEQLPATLVMELSRSI